MRPGIGRGLLAANVAVATIALTAAFGGRRDTTFDEITVHRINVVEPDGRIRMVIANTPGTPGPIEHGKPFGYGAGERQGLIFYNDEETEAGGLIFSGKTTDSNTTAVGSLTFDQYNRDQTVALQYVEDGGRRRSGLAVNDYPGNTTTMAWDSQYNAIKAMTDSVARARALAEWRKLRARNRVWVGRQFNGAAAVFLSDAAGHPRLSLVVDSAGDAAIQFLDDSGKVVRRVGPER